MTAWLLRALAAAAFALALLGGLHGKAHASARDITLDAMVWIDASGKATVDEVAASATPGWQRMDRHQAFALGKGALWMRFALPPLPQGQRWFMLLSGAPVVNRATLYAHGADGGWVQQVAGDQVPVAQWSHPNDAPVFELAPGPARTVWLRVENHPAPTSPFVQLMSGNSLEFKRQWTYLLVGGYLGFGLLVFILGLMHGRLYRDVAFDAYCLYVTCMLMFQLAFTGVGGLYLWPRAPGFNDAAPALFMLLMTGAGIWNIRESLSLRRHSRFVDRGAIAFALVGPVLAAVYVLQPATWGYALLNLYGLAAVALSISLCLWLWRKGEKYAGWLFLGFLPVHLSYPFPALRAAGVIADSWATQYAVLIGSAIEIPLLLYVLHWRAREFSENRARLRALESTDPLTGLTVLPVLRLRLRDALRRARRLGHRCSVFVVELGNHAEIVAQEGREAGDRALVVAASRLTSVVRDVDTVCRVADTRFAILAEGPQQDATRRLIAQHAVARGLESVPQLPSHVTLKFRVVSAWLPDGVLELGTAGELDEQSLLARLERVMDLLLASDGRRVVHHLDARGLSNVAASAFPSA